MRKLAPIALAFTFILAIASANAIRLQAAPSSLDQSVAPATTIEKKPGPNSAAATSDNASPRTSPAAASSAAPSTTPKSSSPKPSTKPSSTRPTAKPATKTTSKPSPSRALLPDEKTVTAVRAESPITIDGRLDEPVWQTAPVATGFTQNNPEDGLPATEPTEVRVAYDDRALYVAAFCHDSEPAKIRKRLGRRDSQTDSDWFAVAVDPYFDRRSGFVFYANPAGSITDAALSNDINEDDSWDGVWESRAAIHDDGWAVEFRIPFDQLRFTKKDEYVWGVNFKRMIRRKNEESTFNWSPRDEAAFVSRFARLEGLSGISPGRLIEFMPYAVTQAQLRPAEEGNPFETGRRALANAGFDLKVGLKSNLTLDATVNPDFGQVEVDPAVLNLSAYETYYQEKRPFFIEGASLFNNFGRGGVFLNANINWPMPRFFYSRRVGRSPQGYATEDGYVRMPDRTTILGAAKLTGQLAGGWNVGFLNAVTGRELAQIDQDGVRLSQEVEPLSYYGALRVQKDIAEGRRGFGLMATGVMRDLEGGGGTSGGGTGDGMSGIVPNDALAAMLNRNAFTLAADGWAFLDKDKSWVVGGWVGGTRVEGGVDAIWRLQNSSVHYFQRPDATHVELDPEATSLSGWGARLNLAKQRGNVLVLFSAGALSPGFNPNDAGFQQGASDVINLQFLPGYQWTKPGKVFLRALAAAGWFRNYDFGGNKNWDGGLAIFEGQLRNFWGVNAMVAYNPDTISKNLTRGGPLALIPSGWQVEAGVTTDSRKPVVYEVFAMNYRRPRDGNEWFGRVSARWKPGSNFSLSVGPTVGLETSEIQWVRRVADELMTATYGARYVFGRIDQKVLGAEVRLDWTFTPRLTLQAYVQPFLAVGHYDRFKELAAPRTYDYHVYGEGGDTGGIAVNGMNSAGIGIGGISGTGAGDVGVKGGMSAGTGSVGGSVTGSAASGSGTGTAATGAAAGEAAAASTIVYDPMSDAYTVDPDGAEGAATPFTFGNPDFNYKSLRGTVVLRWEYRPGSLLYFVWTQNRADFANPGNLRLGRDLGDLFAAPGDNIFLLKVSYRF